MHVTHYLLLGFFAGPAPAPATNGTGGARRIPRKAGRQGQGFGFLPEVNPAQQAKRRRRQQDEFITLHLLTH
jgi:hypothetical protein